MKSDDIIMFRTIKKIIEDPGYYVIVLLYCSVVVFALGMIAAYFF